MNVPGGNTDIKSLREKFNQQLSQSDDHDGIFDLLADLKDKPLLRNLPSENYGRGNVTSRVLDVETKTEIEEALRQKTKGLKASTMAQAAAKRNVNEINVEFVSHHSTSIVAGGSSSSSSSSSNQDGTMHLPTEKKTKLDSTLPEFLVDSRVKGSQQQKVGEGSGVAARPTIAVSAPAVTQADEEEDEDMWED